MDQQVAQCQTLLKIGNQRHSIVFPDQIRQSRQTESQQDQQQNSATNRIYVNPNLSTRSSINAKPLGLKPSPVQPIGSTPSSIGKSEQHQVAEWPFFKSLQVVRNNQLNQQVAPSGQREYSEENTNGEQTASTTTSTTTTASSVSTDNPTVPGNEDPRQTTTSSTTSTTTTSSPLEMTTSAPEEPAESPATTTVSSVDQQMFSPKFHTSIQQAVNRLVKMTSSSPAARSVDLPDVSAQPKVVNETRTGSPTSSKLSLNVLLKNFGRFNLTSLDQILLKSSLGHQKQDAARNNTLGDHQRIEINGIHQVGRASGMRGNSTLSTENSTDQNDDNEQQVASAECKIEYTMKHVNISLINAAKSDYTCDYIIDRKLAASNQDKSRLINEKVCKLHIKSGYFASEPEDVGTTSSPIEATCEGSTYLSIGDMKFCHLQGDLLMGKTLDRTFEFPINRDAFDIKLVHRRKSSGQAEQSSEIHLEIKPVMDADCPTMKTSAESSQEEPNKSTLGVEYETTTTTTTTTTSTTTTTTEAPRSAAADDEELVGRRQRRPPVPQEDNPIGVAIPTMTRTNPQPPRRKFVVKLTHQDPENQLHPLNRIRVSQSFDVSSNSSPLRPRNEEQNATSSASQQFTGDHSALCDPSVSFYASTVGQLMSPNYPEAYPANTRCRLIIRRVSQTFCKLLLHFRDFDLVNENQEGEKQVDCPSDYLQIGDTRYCNKYAMIGHKMLLHFGSPNDPTSNSTGGDEQTTLIGNELQLVFETDEKQSGRGFLIKYQQISCEQPRRSPTFNSKLTTPLGDLGAEQEASAAKSRTVAPPMQQPDFSLALKQTSKPIGAQDQKPEAEKQPTAKKQDEPTSGNELKARKLTTSSTSKQQDKEEKEVQPTNREPKARSSKLRKATTSTSVNNSTSSTPVALMQMASTASSGLLVDPNADLELSSEQMCNQVNNEMSFLMKSQNFPDNYQNNLQCLYYVKRNTSQVCYLQLTFIKFDLEADADCRFDYLEINNVRLCGSLKDLAHKTTRIYMFEENLKVIRFKSDQIGTKSGFLIKADQLECAPNGSILRDRPLSSSGQSRADQAEPQRQPRLESSSLDLPAVLRPVSSSNSSRTFDYDVSLLSSPKQSAPNRKPASVVPRDRSLAPLSPAKPKLNSSSERTSWPLPSSCNDLFYGNEVTIKSPLWPESYANDESISTCKYTIIRNSNLSARNKAICQLELRFVHLRLGFSDCLDIDGHELLCGFNTRNLVKYYPFNERQTHTTITFSTGAAAKVGRSISQAANYTDLLPSSRAPLRFMIIARQLECIDDFLAPQVELNGPTGLNGRVQPTTATSGVQKAPTRSNQQPSPRYVNRTNLLSGPFNAQPQRPSLVELNERQRVSTNQSESVISYDPPAGQHSVNVTSSKSSSGVLMYSFANSNNKQQQLITTSTSKQSCLIQFNQYNGILSSSNILTRMEALNEPIGGECEIRLKLLPGYCRVQLTFGEFDMFPARIGSLCPGDYLELAGVQYCGQELRNSTRTLATTLPGQRHISLRLLNTNAHSFRGIFKQLVCQPEPLELIGAPPAPTSSSNNNRSPPAQSPTPAPEVQKQPDQQQQQQQQHVITKSQIDFREITVRGEFFELDSKQISTGSRLSYDPNMFIIYRLKKSSPKVCKLRLMFYHFDLEASPACKRDFLDINNVDRLCGQLNGADSLSRQYDWMDERDFQISFVSDSSHQLSGFHIFGEQISDPSQCKSTTPANTTQPQQHPTFDDHHTTTRDDQKPAKSRDEQQVTTSEQDKQLPLNCSRLIDSMDFQLASPNWPQRYNAKGNCHYLIRRARPDVCSIRLSVVSMILNLDHSGEQSDEQCDKNHTDYLEVDEKHRLCGLLERPKTIEIDFRQPRSFVALKFSSTANSGYGFYIEGKQVVDCKAEQDDIKQVHQTSPTGAPETPQQPNRAEGDTDDSPGSCNRLLTNEFNLIESLNFPASYPINSDCLYAIRRPNQSVCAIDIIMSHFDLEPATLLSNSCENDYLEVDYSKFCGSYPTNHRLRFNYFDSELDKVVRFRSDGSVNRSGFSLIVRQVSECLPENEEKPASKDDGDEVASKPTPSKTNNDQEQPASRDQDQDHEVISYLPDSSRSSSQQQPGDQQASTSDKANDTSTTAIHLPDQISPSTLCRFIYTSSRQILLSPNYNQHKRTYDNNLDCSYKIIAANYGICSLRLTLLDVDLEQSPDCTNDYLLVDSRRYCGHQSVNESKPVIELEFGQILPREIDLILHTNGHLSSGRGFRALYEQIECSDANSSPSSGSSGEQVFHANQKQAAGEDLDRQQGAVSTSMAQREARRMRFGQLSYPKNYISLPVGSHDHQSNPKSSPMQAKPQTHRHRQESWTADRSRTKANHDARLKTTTPSPTTYTNDDPTSLPEQESTGQAGEQDGLMLRKEIVVMKSKSSSSSAARIN